MLMLGDGRAARKVMNRIALFAICALPLFCFALAAMVELRGRGSLRGLRRMLPLAVAVVLSILLLLSFGVEVYLSYWNQLAMAMSGLSFLAAVGSFFGGYKSRASTVLVFTGGVILTYLWLLLAGRRSQGPGKRGNRPSGF